MEIKQCHHLVVFIRIIIEKIISNLDCYLNVDSQNVILQNVNKTDLYLERKFMTRFNSTFLKFAVYC